MRILCVNASELSSLTVCEVIHGSLGEVEASSSVINGQDVDSLAVVCDAVAGTALGRVPALDTLVATDARERRYVRLSVPSVLGYETVRTVRAR